MSTRTCIVLILSFYSFVGTVDCMLIVCWLDVVNVSDNEDKWSAMEQEATVSVPYLGTSADRNSDRNLTWIRTILPHLPLALPLACRTPVSKIKTKIHVLWFKKEENKSNKHCSDNMVSHPSDLDGLCNANSYRYIKWLPFSVEALLVSTSDSKQKEWLFVFAALGPYDVC